MSLLVALLLTFLTGACSGDAGSGATADGASACAPAGGVDVVASSGPGAWQAEVAGEPLRLEELWRAGGTNEGQELVLPTGLYASPDGRVAIPDFRLAEVIVVEPDGAWSGGWGRRGEGPGEILVPVAATWDAGGRLVVFDIGGSKAVVFGDGEAVEGSDAPVALEFTGPAVASGEFQWAGVQPNGATLLQPGPEPIPDGGAVPESGAAPDDPGRTGEPIADADATGLRSDAILRLPAGATTPDTLAAGVVRTLADGPVSGTLLPAWPRVFGAVGPDGAVAVANARPAYRITVFDSSGTPVRQICRDAPPLPVTDRERGDGAHVPPALLDALRSAPLPDTAQALGRLFWGAGGRLWVQRDRSSPVHEFDALYGVPGALYDVFDPEGRYLGDVRAPEGARLQSAVGDTVWAFEVGELDEVWVVAYRVVRE